MKQITLKIEAGKTEEIGVVGDYVRIKSASVPVRIRDENSDTDASIEQGDALNLKPFQRLRVSHSDAGEQTITLLIGNGTSADSAKVGGSVAVSGDVVVAAKNGTPARGSATLAAVNTQLLAANANRRFLMIQNDDAALDMFIRFDGTAAVVGIDFRIKPGQTITFDSWCASAAVNMIATGPGTVNGIRYMWGE